MTIELIASAVMMLVAAKYSKAIMWHYMVFFGVNLFFLGYELADSSILAMVFAILAIVDTLLATYGKRPVLFISAAVSLALSFESIGNGDWLLSHAVYLSIATNALIIGSLIKEPLAWMNGRSQP